MPEKSRKGPKGPERRVPPPARVPRDPPGPARRRGRVRATHTRTMWGAVGRAGGRAAAGAAAARGGTPEFVGRPQGGGSESVGQPHGGGSPGRPLAGKVAVVTAATHGIGLAVAAGLAGAGARVLLSSRRQPHVEAAVGQLRARGLEVSGVVCHVGQPHSREGLVQKALEIYGGIDILVSNAAVNPVMGSALEADEAAWEKIFQVNVTAAAMLIKLVVPHMEQRGGGAIVLVSSVAGYMPFPALGRTP
ncbi:dehydrogenase/reductase SDR family member 1 [Larus michahellis]|uniref:dehydrogenase/reductase SDR family member 1 n=1 Tax=Larus michahellis TaxID=119627 RepID=UPI003D9B65CF